jgi:two-component system chemotaxis response regulator CheB
MIRVLIVEDSPTVCLLLKAILDSDPDIKVIDIAANGEEGLKKTLTLDPDLITMDVHMPGMDGFEATRRIMAQAPTPILIVTGSVDPNEVKLSFQALEAGALAVVQKPVGPGSPKFQTAARELVQMVKVMADVKVVGRRTIPRQPRTLVAALRPIGQIEVVAIGASTGGPAALASVLGGLPADFSAPILIVQHISSGFDVGLTEWLSSTTRRPVGLAQDGQRLDGGQVFIAPQGKHMGVTASKRILIDSQTESIGAFRPSVTYLFQSVARVYGPHAVGVILTGMGNDGTAGLVALHKAGGYVIAQDEASSVVYGMPGAAVAAGAVDQVLPLERIAGSLSALLKMEEKP